MSAAMIEARSLTLGYGGRRVLDDVDLEVRRGEFWFLLGPNGEGKTTLLSGLLGELPARSGRLTLDPEIASRARIGFVPQRLELRPTLPTTVREFVGLGLVGIRVSSRERRERLSWALEKLDVRGMERRDYQSLSGGQRQRVTVARALARRPSLLIADEPTAGLDPTATETLLRCIADLHRQEGLTLIVATHDLPNAARYGTHFALCSGGSVISGPAAEVLTEENLRRVFQLPVTVHRKDGGPSAVTISRSEDET